MLHECVHVLTQEYQARLGGLQHTDLIETPDKHRQVMHFLDVATPQIAVRCDLCHGIGHDMWKCSSRYAFDAMAKNAGISWEWGATKGAVYY